MRTITRSAGGASAYSRSNSTASRRLDDFVGFRSDGRDSPASSWSPVIDELLRLRALEDDWDGEGSDAPHPALVDHAIILAQNLQAMGTSPPDRIHAGVNATVYFEWHSPLGYTEIEVVSPVEAECRFVRMGSNETEVFYLSRQA